MNFQFVINETDRMSSQTMTEKTQISPEGSITLKDFTWLALPAMASALLNNAYRLIDQYA